jgi:hypothetical protein
MRLLLVAVLAAAGCAPKVVVGPEPPDQDDPRAAAPEPAREPTWAERPVAPSTPRAREGTIARAALLAVLDAGPPAVLQHVEVAAELEGRRFRGWRLVAIDPEHRRFDDVDLEPGDVLVAINGRPLSHPEHLRDLFVQLRSAEVIVADLRRGAGRLQLRWIVTP